MLRRLLIRHCLHSRGWTERVGSTVIGNLAYGIREGCKHYVMDYHDLFKYNFFMYLYIRSHINRRLDRGRFPLSSGVSLIDEFKRTLSARCFKVRHLVDFAVSRLPHLQVLSRHVRCACNPVGLRSRILLSPELALQDWVNERGVDGEYGYDLLTGYQNELCLKESVT